MANNLIIFAGKGGAEIEEFMMIHRELLDQWETMILKNGNDVLEVLKNNQCDVLFSTLQLDDMDCKEFLLKASSQSPSVVRYLLSDQADTGIILDTEAFVHQYINPKIESDSLQGLINNSLGLRKLFVDRKFLDRISTIDSLPSPPKLYGRIVERLKSDDTSLNEIADLIGKDIGISTKLFKMVNSAYFGLRSPVESINHAINVLGLDTVKSIVFSAGVFEQFDADGVGEYTLDNIYNSSVKVGAQARLICHMMGYPRGISEESLMAGMLHNVGKLIMLKEFRPEFELAVETAASASIPLYDAERKIIGTDDAKMGAYLLSLWGMPDSLLQAIANHCKPSESPSQEINTLTMVHLAYAFEYNERNKVRLKDLTEEKSAIDLDYIGKLGLRDDIQNLCQVSAGAAV